MIVHPLHGSPQKNNPGSGQLFIAEQWTTNNGLPIDHINQVFQTPDGFIWMATYAGLVRFDGVEFKLFDTSNTERLPSNRLVRIQKDHGNAFWITTEQGDRVRVDNGTFTLFPELHSMRSVTIFPDEITSKTWIGAETGLFIFEDSVLTRGRPDLFDGARVISLYRRKSGELLVIANHNRTNMYLFPDGDISNEPNILDIGENYSAFIEDETGRLWMARGGIAYLDGNTIIEVETDPSLTALRRPDVPFIHNFKRDIHGAILVSSQIGVMKLENGILTGVDVSEPLGPTTPSRMEGSDITSCADGTVWSFNRNRIYQNGLFEFEAGHPVDTVICDIEKNLWFSSGRNGLLRYRRPLFDSITFSHSVNNFYGVYRDAFDVTWIGAMHNEVNVIDRHGNARNIPFPEDKGTTAVFAELSDGSLLAGNQRCLPESRTESGVCTSFSTVEPIRYEHVRAILQRSDGMIWAGSPNALFKMRMNEDSEITLVEQLPERRVRYMLESESGDLWLATNGDGVLRFSNGNRIRYHTGNGLSSDNIRAMYEDETGHIWVASEDRGLNRIDPVTNEIVIIRKTDGLYDDGLHKMIVDRYGRMWMSTNHGIFRVELEQLRKFADGNLHRVHSTAYTERDGMLNREANGGFQNSGMKTRDGRIYFTTQNGVVIIDPDRIATHSPLPRVILENLIAGSDAFFPSLAATNLGNDQRSFSIQYTSPFFTAPDRVRFSYKLEGFDQEWNDAGSRRQAIYTNIPAGRYQFHVKADLGNDETASAVTTHAIVISPYFYETKWFPFLMILLIAMVIAGGYQLRLRHLVRKEKILEKIVERRTEDLRTEKIKTEEQAEQLRILSQEKNRFFANISHEFRTPLSLIIGPLTDLRDEKYGPLSMEAKLQADMTLRNSRRLLRLVGQLMDLARLEEKKFKINLKTGNICRYLASVSEPFIDAAVQKSIRFHIEIPQEAIFVNFDPGHFDKIVANLLSNAFKFTPEYGTVTLRAEKCGDEVLITVSDTGPGIEAVHLPRLFDRFYQVKKSEQQPGSGIGLALAKELAELHHGKIEVESEVNRGSTFSIHLPVLKLNGDSHLQVETISSLDESDHSIVRNGVHAADSGESLEEHGTIKKTILIVDDHADIRAYLKEHLAEHFAILEAESGNEALTIIQDHLPDLIVSDVMMQDGDGIHLLKNIRNNPDICFLPVILLTAKAEAEDKLSGLDVGANEYITKPFNIRELQARVKNIFEQQKRLKVHLINSNQDTGYQIHHDTVQTESADDVFLKTVKKVIQNELSNEDFSVEILAQKVNQSRSNLHRRLTALTGETPSSMIRRIRLELGAQLLSQNAGSVSEIAYSTGFKSVSHFSRAFAQHFGVSPSQYQETVE